MKEIIDVGTLAFFILWVAVEIWRIEKEWKV